MGNLFTKENAAEMGRRGGIASGEARQSKKRLREMLNEVGRASVSAETAEEIQAFLNGEGGESSHSLAVAIAVYREAESGNMQAARLIYDNEGVVENRETSDMSEFAESLRGIAAQIDAITGDEED